MITDPQSIKFSNEWLRVFARRYKELIAMADDLVEYYNSRPELGVTFTNNMAEIINDGADADGRPIVTGNEALNLLTRAVELHSLDAATRNTILRYWDGMFVR